VPDPLFFDALVITKAENVRYLSGFTGSSAVAVITGEAATIFTDGRYREQVARETANWNVNIVTRDITESIAASLHKRQGAVGLEDSSTIAFQQRLIKSLPDSTIEFTSKVVETMRERKDPTEIEAIRLAAGCARRAWENLLPMISPGVSERELAARLDFLMMSAGADKPAFDTIVASGPNSSMPHARITDRRLEQGDLVVIDFGALKDGYCCDVTRTICLGEPTQLQARVTDVVREASDAAFAILAPGVAAADVDRAARERLEALGFAENFVHGLGHGVGLEAHEKPTLSSLSTDTLEPGMVFTIEPGVYIEGEFGARHEETVLLTENGANILT